MSSWTSQRRGVTTCVPSASVSPANFQSTIFLLFGQDSSRKLMDSHQSLPKRRSLTAIFAEGGCRWCLCTSRWLEAYQAYRSKKVSYLGVPRVDMDATEDSVLSMVDLNTLRQFAVQRGPGKGPDSGSTSS
ncbi:hypothetical protein F4859DRAFT_491948 [Xylaria cf. heliscus]|nr:hypothetical protein F4859DRAFT_491948 [Xylaria cf. heliscus]